MKLESPYPHEEILAKRLSKGESVNLYEWHNEAKKELMLECSSVYVEVIIWQTDGCRSSFYTTIHDAFPFVDSFPRNWTIEIRFLNQGESDNENKNTG